jgi:hypothetical protein
MPISVVGQLSLNIVINQVSHANGLLSIAIAVLVDVHSQTIHRRLSQLSCGKLLYGSNHGRAAHAVSVLAILPPEKLPASRSGFAICTPEMTTLIT